MCGIVAILSNHGHADPGGVRAGAELLRHRGPDDRGEFNENGVALEFRRLAIFDPSSSGHQPMISADARYVVVFNGAIYNFLELRQELQTLGHRFRSNSDTEVLLTAYQQWGRECLHRLNGMWAFLIYDRRDRVVFGARDRFGVKPLFWSAVDRGIVFASEIKSIRDVMRGERGMEMHSIAAFLIDGNLDVDEHTFYQGIYSVPAGTAFEWRPGQELRWWQYWSLTEAAQKLEEPDDPVAAFRELFDDAVRIRMRSDVPLAVQLSGGLDSSAIITTMAEHLRNDSAAQALLAFCYMDPRFDESALIGETLELTGARLFELDSTPGQLWDSIAEHLWYQDEPVHSFASVVGYQLMGLARSQGVKVILNGQGADEVLGGYPSYFNEYWAELIRRGRWWAASSGMRRLAAADGRSSSRYMCRALRTVASQCMQHVPTYRTLASIARRRRVQRMAPWISQDVKSAWREPRPHSARTLQESLKHSVERSPLPMHLRAEDRNSMAHGIELRLPFLDYRLVTFAFALGAHWKIAGEYTKVLLRTAMRGRVPDSISTRVQKFGFPTSIDAWFRSEFYEPLRDLLASADVKQSGLWNTEQLERDLELHRAGQVSLGRQFFDVTQLSLLLRMAGASVSAGPAAR